MCLRNFDARGRAEDLLNFWVMKYYRTLSKRHVIIAPLVLLRVKQPVSGAEKGIKRRIQ